MYLLYMNKPVALGDVLFCDTGLLLLNAVYSMGLISLYARPVFISVFIIVLLLSQCVGESVRKPNLQMISCQSNWFLASRSLAHHFCLSRNKKECSSLDFFFTVFN